VWREGRKKLLKEAALIYLNPEGGDPGLTLTATGQGKQKKHKYVLLAKCKWES